MSFFFFNDTATTEIYTLSLHDALPICPGGDRQVVGAAADRVDGMEGAAKFGGDAGSAEPGGGGASAAGQEDACQHQDRKSTRLNSSHSQISYAVFCLKKKTTNTLDGMTSPQATPHPLSISIITHLIPSLPSYSRSPLLVRSARITTSTRHSILASNLP